MFVAAVCILFLVKLKWPKNKSVYGEAFYIYTIMFQPKDLYIGPWYKKLFWWLHIHVSTITQGPWHSYLRYTTNSYTSTSVWRILVHERTYTKVFM